MKLETKSLEKALDYIKKAHAPTVSLKLVNIAGIERAVLQFKNLAGDTVIIELAEESSGGFDKITKSERF